MLFKKDVGRKDNNRRIIIVAFVELENCSSDSSNFFSYMIIARFFFGKNFIHRGKSFFPGQQERMKIPFKRKGNRVRQASLSRWLKLQRQSNWGNPTRAEAPHVSFYLTLSRLMRFTG